MNNFLKLVFIVIVIAILGILFYFVLNASLSTSEVFQCNKWNAEAVEYGSNYYVTSWQVAQCDAHSIVLNATVK